MATVSKVYTFANGDIIDAIKFNVDFDTIYNEFNGNIDNANIKSGAGIIGSKIASSPNGIDTAQINDIAVTAAKLRFDAATDGNRAVTTNHIRDQAVNNAKILDSSIKLPTKISGFVCETVAFSISYPGGFYSLWIERKTVNVSGTNYYKAAVLGYPISVGSLGYNSGDITPVTPIPIASKYLIGLYMSDLSSGGGFITGNVTFVSVDIS